MSRVDDLQKDAEFQRMAGAAVSATFESMASHRRLLDAIPDLLAVVEAAQAVDHQCQYGPNYGYDECPLCASLAAFEEHRP